MSERHPSTDDLRAQLEQALRARDHMTLELAAFGKSIANKRRSLSISQSDLAQRLGVSQSAITDWERSRSRPRADMRLRLAEILDLDIAVFDHVDQLLDGIGNLHSEVAKLQARIEAQNLSAARTSLPYPKSDWKKLFSLLWVGIRRVVEDSGLSLDDEELAFIVADKWSSTRIRLIWAKTSEEGEVVSIEHAAEEEVSKFRRGWGAANRSTLGPDTA